MKKLLAFVLSILMLLNSTALADLIVLDKMGGLARNPKADRIEDGQHDRFQNVFIDYGNLQVVKGRVRLNTTAHTDIVVNGLFYYENQSGSTKKIVVAESDELVTYNIDGTNRTQIANTLTNERWDAQQIGDTLYLTSSTNGLYKWTGSGSANLITASLSTPSVTVSASSNVGGLTTGSPAIVGCIGTNNGTGVYEYVGGVCTIFAFSNLYVGGSVGVSHTLNGVDCDSISTTYFNKLCAGSSSYSYKATFYNTITGLESEAGSLSSVSLKGPNTAISTLTNPRYFFNAAGCATLITDRYESCAVEVGGSGQTSTSGTLTVPSSPFNSVKLYRTTAGGSDYFLVNIIPSGGAFTDGKPDNALSTPLDTTLDTIDPPSFRYIEEYKGVIFVGEGDTIKFNKIPVSIATDADKHWLDTDELQVVGNITGMKKASDSLLIFTNSTIYQLTGFGVDSFKLLPIIQGIGAVSDETIEVDTNGDVYFFAGSEGLYKLVIGQQQTNDTDGAIVGQRGAQVIKVSSPAVDSVFIGDDTEIDLDPTDYTNSHAYYDSDNDLYHIYIGSNSFIYDAEHASWSYVPATQMIASLWRNSPNAAGVGVLTDNVGFFWNNWTTYSHGLSTGTASGTTTSSTSTTLTCSGCTFNTTGDGLKGVWVYVDNENGEYRQITSNTSTTLTISTAWTTNPISSDKFYVGHIVTNWRTKQYSAAKPPQETGTTLFYINHNKSDSEQEVFVYSYQNKSDLAVNAFTDGGSLDFAEKFIHVVNTRMRGNWVQWEMKSFVNNTSTTANPPIDVVSYAIEAEQKERVS